MRMLIQDVGLAVRTLMKNRGFAAASVLTLVLGILLNTGAFSIMNAVWFRPLPFRADEQIVILSGSNPRKGVSGGISYQDYLDLQSRSQLFEGFAAFSERPFNVSEPGSGARAPAQVQGGELSANAIALLGVRPVLGRSFTIEEERTGAPVALIGEDVWRRRFDGDPRIAGKRINVDGRTVTVLGVLPYEFRFVYSGYDVFVPLSPETMRAPRAERSLAVLGRIRPGTPGASASADAAAVAARLANEYPATNEGWGVDLTPYRDFMDRRHSQYAVLLAAAALVLLIACANISGLFLAKAMARQRDVAIRLALGGPRWVIVRQMLTEGMVIAIAGGGIATVGACWLRQILVASVPQMRLLEIDFRVLGYTLAVSVAAGLAFGLAPALAASRPDMDCILRSGGRGHSGARGQRLRSALVVCELALGLMLLAGTGLLARTMANLRYVDVGFRTQGLYVSEVTLRGERYAEPEARERFWKDLTRRVAAAPGVERAAITGTPPLSGWAQPQQIEIEGVRPAPGGDYTRLVTTVADTQYADLLGLRLLAGRRFTETDREGAPAVAIVNAEFARRRWPGAAPSAVIGRRIRIGESGEWLTVSGVVANMRQSLTEPAFPEVIMPYAQSRRATMNIVVRAAAGATGVGDAIRRELRALDPDLPMSGPSTMEGLIENSSPMVLIVGIGAFAAVAMVLATLGLYGVMSFLVVQRTQEIGVRVAMGASRAGVLRLVLGHALKLASAGAVLGLAGAFALARVLAGFLYGVGPADPVVFGGTTIVLWAVALVAGAIPALRASRVDPIVALRYE